MTQPSPVGAVSGVDGVHQHLEIRVEPGEPLADVGPPDGLDGVDVDAQLLERVLERRVIGIEPVFLLGVGEELADRCEELRPHRPVGGAADQGLAFVELGVPLALGLLEGRLEPAAALGDRLGLLDGGLERGAW